MTVPYSFANATVSIPLSQLDANFNTPITLGNTAIQLGNTVTTLNNMTLANVTISSGNVTITNVSVTTANVTTLNATTVIATTANVTTANITTGNVTNMSSGNVTITGGSINGTTLGATTASTANVTTLTTSSTVTINGGTANGVAYLDGSKVLTTGSALTFDGTNLGVNVTPTANQGRIQANGSGQSWFKFYDSSAGWNFGTFYKANGTSALAYLGGGGGSAIAGGTVDDFVVRAEGNMLFAISTAEQMRLTSTGLGIGTSSPTFGLGTGLQIAGAGYAALSLKKGSAGTGHAIDMVDSSNTLQFRIGTNFAGGGNNLLFAYGTTPTIGMTMDTSGNLGLGVTPSAWASGRPTLEFGGSVQPAIAFNGNATNGGAIWTNAYFDGTNRYKANGAASRFDTSGGAFSWFIAPSGTAGDAISFTQAMTLDASGNLGIGTTTIGSRLTIGDPGTGLGFTNAASGNFNLGLLAGTGSADAYVYQRANAALIIATNNTERARITSGGDLLVGTTSSIGKLTVEQTGSNANGAFIINQTYNYQTLGLHNTATANDNLWVTFGTEATFATRGSIDYNRAGGLTRYNTTSDYRAKDIIGPVTDPGAQIDALKVYSGKMHGATIERPMMIAHEAQQVAPYAVSGVKDEVNEDGTPKYQQMDHASLVPLLIAEIQSLRARVAQLENLKGN